MWVCCFVSNLFFLCFSRFYCEDRGRNGLPIHISLSARCDAVSDCKDESDERGCNKSTHFYCDAGTPFYIPRKKVSFSLRN